MDTSAEVLRDSHRLIQIGMSLFLMALLVGLAVPLFAVPRLGLSTHLLGIMQGLFLMLTGLLWPKLRLSRTISRIAFWLAIYGCFAAWTANLLAAIWAAGNTMLPLAAKQAQGSPVQEAIIAAMLRSAAVSLILAVVLILYGLRRRGAGRTTNT